MVIIVGNPWKDGFHGKFRGTPTSSYFEGTESGLEVREDSTYGTVLHSESETRDLSSRIQMFDSLTRGSYDWDFTNYRIQWVYTTSIDELVFPPQMVYYLNPVHFIISSVFINVSIPMRL